MRGGPNVLPDTGFAPEAVRLRAYATGTALGLLLDRFTPHWPRELERNDSSSLDALLSALETESADPPTCGFTAAERDSIAEVANRQVAGLRAGRAERRRVFLEQPGWRLVVESPGAPLLPQGFDPVNVHVVGDGEVLHTRFIKLGSDAGTVEVLGRAALTEAAGDHPLFNGVRRIMITGLVSEPEIIEANGVTTVTADGVQLELHGATVDREGRTVTIRRGLTEEANK